MKKKEISELSVDDLQSQLVSYKKQYADLKMSHHVTPLDNPLQIRSVRKTVARLATELTIRDNQ